MGEVERKGVEEEMAELTFAFARSFVSPRRHRRYQANKHGGADRGHHCRRVPPDTLQPVHVLVVQGNHQARGHERVGSVRFTCEASVQPSFSLSSPTPKPRAELSPSRFPVRSFVLQSSRRRRIPPTSRSSLKSSLRSRTSSSPRTVGSSSRETTSPSRSGTSRWRTSPSRPSTSTITFEESSAICTRTTASSTSSSVPSVEMERECFLCLRAIWRRWEGFGGREGRSWNDGEGNDENRGTIRADLRPLLPPSPSSPSLSLDSAPSSPDPTTTTSESTTSRQRTTSFFRPTSLPSRPRRSEELRVDRREESLVREEWIRLERTSTRRS